MSGRERLIGRRDANNPQLGWLENRIAEGQSVFVEPLVEVIEECGTQFEISRTGDVNVVGTTRLLTTENGAFAGSLLSASLAPKWLDTSVVAAVASSAAKAGYFGPLGVDSALCVVDGNEFARPIQDVNGRYTMGRLALGWLDTLRQGEQAAWLFVSGGDSETIRNRLAGVEGLRATHTSQTMIGNRRSNLSTWLLASADPQLLRRMCHEVFSSINRTLRW